ncbi:uncharacterized protein LOC120555386 isoform X1 [Perca fluviatilis]|uniref:uncharacterized protein LOC120555386 isoform X1 n=1 Tax=Perca fluviatilis TaxID=8168 RepID=UPI001962F0B4|nr:uncharacterized protein LOC120555386 isoform X1 [Perca fluviatilis]
MEVAPCVQKANSRAASLLASLNLQRGRAQFCDCVVRQRQNLSQLHPAHRCVLAASSPVLASILSSSGALVELQAPCLSDSVLVLLLDYIYTGALPYTHSQRQYYNLLAAACHLQMSELQEALKAWHQTADDTNASAGAKNQPHKDINNTYSKTVNTFSKHLPLSLEREDHQYSATVDTHDDLDPCRTSIKTGANHCSRKDASTISNASTCSVNTGDYRQVTHLTPEDLIQNIPCTAEGHVESGVDKGEVQNDPFHSAYSDCIEEELEKTHKDRRSLTLPCSAEVQEEEMSRAEKKQRLCLTVKSKAEEKETNRKEEDKTQTHLSPLLCLSASHLRENVPPSQCSSSSSSSSPHPCCGAVPVIRHSSRAAMLHLAEVSPMPPHHPVSQTSCSSNRAPDSPSGSTDSDSIVEGITATHKNHYGEQNNDDRYNKEHIGTQNWDQKDSSNQSHILKQDYDSSNTDHFIGQNDEHMSNGLSHITDHNDRHAYCDSFQNNNRTKHLRDDLVPQNEESSNFARGLQCKPDISFDDFTSKHQRLDCSDCQNVWMATAAEEQYIRLRDTSAVVSLPVQDSNTGSDSHCEDLCSQGETKEEYNYSRCPAGTDRQDSHCNIYGPKADWYTNLHRARSTKDAASSQHEHDSDNRDTPMMDRRHSVDVCRPVSTTPESCLDSVTGGLSGIEHRTSVELGKMSGTELTEPTFTMSMAHNTTDPTYSIVGPSYCGHLQYHCLPQEETYLSHRYSGRKHSHPSHSDHSDQSSGEGEVGTFASPGYSPLRQQFATGTTDQILLLDINATPAELLVANAIHQKETFGNGFGNNDREQWTEAKSVACVDTKYQVGETNVEERQSVGKDQSRPGAEVIHKAGVEEGVSNPINGQSQAPTLAVCSPTDVQDSIQASMSSTLSICIPSTLAASMATNLSVHLPNPVHHPFKCSLCHRAFSQRGSLNRHVRSHLGVRPFPCPRCPMTFSRQYRVTEHMRVHQRCVLGRDLQQPPASSI